MSNVKLKYIATVSPFVLAFAAMAIWMLSDLIGIEKLGDTYTYRVKHNFALLLLPFAGFMLVSGVFIARLGRIAALFSLFFFGFALYAGWFAVTSDMSNQHVRVNPDEVYSEWGTMSDPVSVTINFRDLDRLALASKMEGENRQRYIVATTRTGTTIEMPVNDIVQVALKRIFLNARIHNITLEFDDSSVPME